MAVNTLGLDTNGSTLTTTVLDELIEGGLRQRASDHVRTIAFLVLDLAQSIVPVDTGHLKASLQVGDENNVFEFEPLGLVALVGTAVVYAVYVEYGTRHMAAQPYLSVAVEMARPAWEAGMDELFGAGVGI